jgi:hypothetical protein
MKSELPLSDQQLQLLPKALDGAVRLDQQLNSLLDLYDFYTQRYPANDASGELELRDLQVSIKALGQLPELIALNLVAWRTGMEPTLSRVGFETNVLNEMLLHMHALATFFKRKGLDLDPYSGVLVKECMNSLRLANNIFGTVRT